MMNILLIFLSLNLIFFSFPPYNLWFLVFFEIVPLLFVLSKLQKLKWALILSFLFPVLACSNLLLGMTYYYNIKIYLLGIFLFGLIEGMVFILFWLIYTKLQVHFIVKAFIFAFISLFPIYLENTINILFPGLNYLVLTSFPFLLQSMKFAGIYSTAFVIALINFLIFQLLSGIKLKHFIYSLLPVTLVWIGLNTSSYILYNSKKYEAYTVSTIQGSTPIWAFKESFKNQQTAKRIEDRYFQLLEKTEKSDFIIFPEIFSPSSHSYLIEKMKKITEKRKTSIIFGVNLPENQKLYNSVAFLSQNNSIQFYRKQNIVPLIEDEIYSSGKKISQPVEFEKIKWGTGICYENLFSDHFKTLRFNGAETLLVLSDDAGLKQTITGQIHAQFSILRAIENNAYLIHSSQAGPSFIVDQNGNISKKTNIFEQTVLNGKFIPNKNISFFVQISDGLIIIFFGLITLIIFFIFRKK